MILIEEIIGMDTKVESDSNRIGHGHRYILHDWKTLHFDQTFDDL